MNPFSKANERAGFITRSTELDWGELAPLQLRAKLLADGIFSGAHRSVRRGAGVEFAGHRVYVPGDELRFVDVRASMRHQHVLVRQFETETERALRLLVDASVSMRHRSSTARGAKYAYAALLAAALTRISITAGDPVGLDWLAGGDVKRVMPRAGRETFERVVGALEGAQPQGDLLSNPALIEETLGVALRGARRGSTIVVLSDFLDLPSGAMSAIAALGTRGRRVVAVELLDPDEATFPFEGPVVFRALEGDGELPQVQTDGSSVRAGYLAALAAHERVWQQEITRHAGVWVRCVTSEEPIHALRAIVRAVGNQT